MVLQLLMNFVWKSNRCPVSLHVKAHDQDFALFLIRSRMIAFEDRLLMAQFLHGKSLHRVRRTQLPVEYYHGRLRKLRQERHVHLVSFHPATMDHLSYKFIL
jgi:hypothetical protein